MPADGKIQFKKPDKRKSNTEEGDSSPADSKKSKKKLKEKVKSTLLSFGEEEEDEWRVLLN